MKLKVKNGYIYNEEGYAVAMLTDVAGEEEERTIELGSEAIPVIEKFIADVNSGSFKPRSAVKEFEALLAKYNS